MSTLFSNPSIAASKPASLRDQQFSSWPGQTVIRPMLQLWVDRITQRRALSNIADNQHLLNDIGLTRSQALTEASQPFWR